MNTELSTETQILLLSKNLSQQQQQHQQNTFMPSFEGDPIDISKIMICNIKLKKKESFWFNFN
jgi:hypothetical protein